jgi:uncharacterized membrane protein YphA (DoxX/SURF4 family)
MNLSLTNISLKNISLENTSNTAIITTLIVLMFLLSGFEKIFSFNNNVISLQQKTITSLPLYFYKFIILLVILIEIVAPSIIMYSSFTNKYKNLSYYSILSLIIFTLLATFIYHPLNIYSYKKSIPFWANMSITGGLLLLLKLN